MARTERPTHQLRPGDTIQLHTDQATGQVWPAIVASTARTAVVLDPPLLGCDPSWYDDTVTLATLNTSAGPCLVSLAYRWLLAEPVPAQLRLVPSPRQADAGQPLPA